MPPYWGGPSIHLLKSPVWIWVNIPLRIIDNFLLHRRISEPFHRRHLLVIFPIIFPMLRFRPCELCSSPKIRRVPTFLARGGPRIFLLFLDWSESFDRFGLVDPIYWYSSPLLRVECFEDRPRLKIWWDVKIFEYILFWEVVNILPPTPPHIHLSFVMILALDSLWPLESDQIQRFQDFGLGLSEFQEVFFGLKIVIFLEFWWWKFYLGIIFCELSLGPIFEVNF